MKSTFLGAIPAGLARSFASTDNLALNASNSVVTHKHANRNQSMKRDMNLIRDLLLFYESDCTLPYPTADGGAISQHIIWLIEAGLIAGRLADSSPSGSPRSFFPVDGRTMESDDGRQCMYFPLSWDGCEFLAAARDDNRWNKAVKVVGGFTFEIIKTYLQSVILKSITGEHGATT